MSAHWDVRRRTAPSVDAAAFSADAEQHQADVDSALAGQEDLTAATFPPGWQREAHRWSAASHRAAARRHSSAAAQHELERVARSRSSRPS